MTGSTSWQVRGVTSILFLLCSNSRSPPFDALFDPVDNPLEKWVEVSTDANNDETQFIAGKHGAVTKEDYRHALANLKTVCDSLLSPLCLLFFTSSSSFLLLFFSIVVWVCGNLRGV